jgi:DNA-binding HxlR family transcriptional regulator
LWGKNGPSLFCRKSPLEERMERSGLVEKKTIKASSPKKTSYALTEKGKELYELSLAFRKWEAKHIPMITGCESRECVKCPHY